MRDFLGYSRRVPLVVVERCVPVADLVAARKAMQPTPSWTSILVKAHALVCAQRPELRRSYLSFPYARFFQHEINIAHIAMSRDIAGEDAILGLRIREPETLSITAIDQHIRRAQTAPLEEIGDFRRALKWARVPGPFRRMAFWTALHAFGSWRGRLFGTFGVTGVAAFGSSLVSWLSPMTTTVTIGVISDGRAPIRLLFDHRVLDGKLAALTLRELELALQGPIHDELRRPSEQPSTA